MVNKTEKVKKVKEIPTISEDKYKGLSESQLAKIKSDEKNG